MKTSVLFILDSFDHGGVTSFIHLYIDALSKKYRVFIIGRQGNLSNPSKFFPGVNIIEVKKLPRESFTYHVLGGFRFIAALNSIYKNNKILTIHLSTSWSTIYALLLPFTWKINRLITYYGANDLEMASMRLESSSISNILGDFLRHQIQRFGLVTSNTIVTFSTYAKNQLITHFSFSQKNKEKIIIIPGLIRKVQNIDIIQKKHLFTIINIGRAEPRKGITVLLHALHILKKRGIPFQSYIASPTVYFKHTNIMETYENLNLFTHVHFIHAVSDKEKNDLLKKADIFVMPSLDLETFGLTIIESLSHGVPVIGTPSGAIPEILKPINARLVAKSITAQSLADSIMWFYQLPEKEKRIIQQKSITAVQNKYLLKNWASKIESLYNYHETINNTYNTK